MVGPEHGVEGDEELARHGDEHCFGRFTGGAQRGGEGREARDLSAFQDAKKKVEGLLADKMQEITGGLPMPRDSSCFDRSG